MLAHPVLLVGAGALGSSLLKGLRLKGQIAASDMLILDLNPGEEAHIWAQKGARLNTDPETWREAKTIILAVKPQVWREVAQILSGNLNPDVVLISVMAGVKTNDLSEVFLTQKIARVMPTTAVATTKGVASLFAMDKDAMTVAQALFSGVATCVILEAEGLIDAATAVSGSGPAYVYAFATALERAALETGLKSTDAKALARATLISAAKL
jgi:pyrroline-5-carboxylate reductase